MRGGKGKNTKAKRPSTGPYSRRVVLSEQRLSSPADQISEPQPGPSQSQESSMSSGAGPESTSGMNNQIVNASEMSPLAAQWLTPGSEAHPLAASLSVCQGQIAVPHPPVLPCISDGLGCHVTQSVRDKIQTNQYINMSVLLKSASEMTSLTSQGNVLYIDNQGQIMSKPKVLNEPIQSIEKWTDAFIIFSSIYCLKFKDKLHEMLGYMSIIRQAAALQANLNWRSYDENFRMRQSMNLQPWDKINADLWLRIMTPSVGKISSSTEASARTGFTQGMVGVCFAYNSGSCQFSPCRYRHVCNGCSGNHPQIQCPVLKPQNKPFRASRGQFRGKRAGFQRRF